MSAWEIVINHALGKLSLPMPPAEYIPSRIADCEKVGLTAVPRHITRPLSFRRILVALTRRPGALA